MYYISDARYPGKKVSRPGVRFGLLLPLFLTFVCLGSSQTLYWATPPRRWWRNVSLWGVKVSVAWWTVCHRGRLWGGIAVGVWMILVWVMICVFLAKLVSDHHCMSWRQTSKPHQTIMSLNRQNSTSTPCSTSTQTQNQSSNQTSENQDDNQWPRFLIMEAADKNIPLNLNAFVLKKAIDGMANADRDNVKPMKSGSVFIEEERKQQCKNLLKTTKLLGYLPVKVSPHRTLKSSKFVIKCQELDKMDEEEIKKELQPQGIIAVKNISIRYSMYVLTIKGQTIKKKINVGYLKKTRPYIPNPQRCFQCQKFGHTM